MATGSAETTRRAGEGALWVGLYVALALAPLAILLVGERPDGRGFWRELSASLGFVGLAMLGLQFAITARFRRIARPFGIDIILQFHRQISLIAFGFILAHPLIVFVVDPAQLALLDVLQAPWRARFGVLALLGLFILIATSIWRKALRLRYERWRIVHGALAIVVLLLALGHVLGVGHYLALPWKRAVWVGMTLGAVALTGYVRLVKPLRMLRRPYEVETVREERGDAWTLTFKPVGHDGIRFQPGQFAWLTLDVSPFAIREHPFSFSSSAHEPERPAFTIKKLGDFTGKIPEVKPGTRAYIDGPYGAFTPDKTRSDGFVLVAGGIGITPMMSILRTLAHRRDRRPLVLLHAADEWEVLTFREEIQALRERLDLTVAYAVEDLPEGAPGKRGRIDRELLEEHIPVAQRASRFYFICGPPPMMESVAKDLVDLGVPHANVLFERFELV